MVPVADEYIYISSFEVEPINAIEVSYTPNSDSHTYPIQWSYQPSNPSEFSKLFCNSNNYENDMSNSIYETFTCSEEIVLQDTGVLKLKISPIIFAKNPTDSVWSDDSNNFTYSSTYYGFKPIIDIPISIMSEFDANREIIEENQQILHYQFNYIQAQLAEDQKTESVRSFSLALFVLAFAFVDIAVALYAFSKNEDKEAESKKRKENEKQRQILEYLEREAIE